MAANALRGWLQQWRENNWQQRGKPVWAAPVWQDITAQLEKLVVTVCHERQRGQCWLPGGAEELSHVLTQQQSSAEAQAYSLALPESLNCLAQPPSCGSTENCNQENSPNEMITPCLYVLRTTSVRYRIPVNRPGSAAQAVALPTAASKLTLSLTKSVHQVCRSASGRSAGASAESRRAPHASAPAITGTSCSERRESACAARATTKWLERGRGPAAEMARRAVKGLLLLEIGGVLGAILLYRAMDCSQDFRYAMQKRFPSILEVYYKSNEWSGIHGIREKDQMTWLSSKN
ncbi:protein CEBPZOS [Colius striatus]|uniref:protein CEBPZOS n=1 Tax=Colius striatus TaxID=57412 RepID=UPI002B1D0753|nr:protein CEBPZOS [Colius striatus]